MTIAITDVVLRDAHQSLFATRLRLDDMLPIAAQLDDVGYGSLECWGGATLTPASVSSAKTRGFACVNSKSHAQNPAADAAARPEPARLPPLRRRRGGALRRTRGEKRYGRVPRLRRHERPAQYESRTAGGAQPWRPRRGTLSYTTSPAHTLQTGWI